MSNASRCLALQVAYARARAMFGGSLELWVERGGDCALACVREEGRDDEIHAMALPFIGDEGPVAAAFLLMQLVELARLRYRPAPVPAA